MVCQLAYIPEQLLVHAVGLAPTKDRSGPPDLQSGAFATRRTHACSDQFVLQNG